MRILAAMSGGVDSAVAAALAVDAGHDVTGVHLALSPDRQTLRSGARGCCSVEDAHDARRVADELGIPFYVWDLAERFREDVVEDFVAEYAAGRTPNPCLRCNEKIKFSAVLDRARALGFDAVVTGHHARLADGKLRRSVDAAKDQSYVLGVLTAGQLEGAVFPLGGMTKERVRAIAAERGFAVAAKPDSHDICFIPDGDTRGFLSRRLGSRPGPVVDAATGAKVGEHDGTYGFTVGQRRGLGVAAGDSRPRYVLGIEPVSRTVTIGTADLAGVGEVWTAPPTWTGEAPELPFRGEVQLRAHGAGVPCAVVATGDGGLRIILDEQQRGIAPGQSAVLYAPDTERGDLVLGQGTVLRAGERAGSVSARGLAGAQPPHGVGTGPERG
jgi:tRNA-uridine 2-sulfurtransferase